MFGENVTPLLILLVLTHIAAVVMIIVGRRGLRRNGVLPVSRLEKMPDAFGQHGFQGGRGSFERMPHTEGVVGIGKHVQAAQ